MMAAAALPFVSAGFQAVSGVASFMGGLQARSEGKKEAKAAYSVGKANASRVRRQNAALQGQQEAAYSTSGVTLDGTPSEVIAESAFEGEIGAQSEIYAGAIAARNASRRGQRGFMAGVAGGISAIGSAASTIVATDWFKNVTKPAGPAPEYGPEFEV